MKNHPKVSRTGLGRISAGAVLGGMVAIALAGCHVDPNETSSGGGSASAASSQNTQQSSSGSVRPAPTPTANPVSQSQATQSQAASNATAAAQCGGFPGGGMVYKPHSEGDGNLVVLIQSFQAESSGAAMADRSGRVIEQGRFVGRTNGNRPTYRFGRPGHAFPSPGILIVGGARICIPNTGQRYD